MIVRFEPKPETQMLLDLAGKTCTAPCLFFRLNCIPTPQERVRHTRCGMAYKSRQQKANERTLEALLAKHVPPLPITGGVELSFTALFPPPKSVSKRKRARMLAGEICHTVKPDLDNLAKQLKDAMTRMRYWHDDSQVVGMRCAKRYGEKPGWIVQVTGVGDEKCQG